MRLTGAWDNRGGTVFPPIPDGRRLEFQYPLLRQAMDNFDMASIVLQPAPGGGFHRQYRAFYNTETQAIGILIAEGLGGFAEDFIELSDTSNFAGTISCSKMVVGEPLGVGHRVQLSGEVSRCENRMTEYTVQADEFESLALPNRNENDGFRRNTATFSAGFDPLCVDNF